MHEVRFVFYKHLLYFRNREIFKEQDHIKTMRINEQRLRRIVKESIDKFLDGKTGASKDDIFDLDRIPMEVLDKGFQRYHPYTLNISHRNPLASTRRLSESTDYYKQIADVKNTIRSTFPIAEEQFEIVEGAHGLYAAILVALTEDNADIIEKAMESQGFFRSQPTDAKLLTDRKNRQWLDMRFEPISPDDVTEEIKEKYNYICHLAPSVMEKDVERKGLVISNNNPEYRNSEARAFAAEGDVSDSDIQEIANALYEQAKGKNIPNLSPEYTLFKIDLSLTGKDVRFFYDINEKKGLYTKTAIQSEAIVGKSHVTALSGKSDVLPW